jgi:hypothetical protein
MDVQQILLEILNNPSNLKPYLELAKYYRIAGKTNESSAIFNLVEKRKNEDNSPNSNEK